MIDPAHVPPLLAQAQIPEIVAASEGLSKGGAYFIAAVLAFAVFALWRELSTERAARMIAIIESGKSERALIEKHSAEMLAAMKESTSEMIALVKESRAQK